MPANLVCINHQPIGWIAVGAKNATETGVYRTEEE